MQIDHCLILAAGFGTRMGSIGQKLPKVLWPVYERPLLDLQVAYAKSLGIENIFINVHYFADEIIAQARNKSVYEGVTFLNEQPEILDIGGGIHNLASKVGYKGRLLVLNADQFFYLTKEQLHKYLDPYEKFPAALFTYNVDSTLGYNALQLGTDRLVKKIIPNKELKPSIVETYTGISMIDLSKLEKVEGKSAFFDSVCPFTKKDIPGILLQDIDYWDFGTVKRFWETSHRIMSTYLVKSTHPFLRFLVSERAMKTWKINPNLKSYNAASPGVINLNADPIKEAIPPQIILRGPATLKAETVVWDKIESEVK